MDYIELMTKEDYYISFENFSETKDNGIALSIILYGSTNETALLIAPHEPVDVLQIDFPSYATYSVTFEDFTVFNDNELYQGRAFRIYEKSDLMNYLKKRTNLEDQEKSRGKAYQHFSLACMEHQVDIVSKDQPAVKIMSLEEFTKK